LFEELINRRADLLWWEIAAILHDIGKLSAKFIDYRQSWPGQQGGYNTKDPHETRTGDGGWLDRDPFRPLGQSFLTKTLFTDANGEIYSIKDAIDRHIDSQNWWQRNGNYTGVNALHACLYLGDSADSRYDRNNPLISNEQFDADGNGSPPTPYRANVYGYERPLDKAALEDARRELLQTLDATNFDVAKWLDYKDLKSLLEVKLSLGMSDTTRPSNDTTLFEHTYSVATLCKAFQANYYLNKSTLSANTNTFTLLGLGIDTLRFASHGQRIGDVKGRIELVRKAFNQVRRLIEHDLALGNRVYDDSNFQVYLIANFEGKVDLRVDLEKRVIETFGEGVEWEAAPSIEWLHGLRSTTEVATVLDKLHDAIRTPWPTLPAAVQQKFDAEWANCQKDSVVCPICRLRPSDPNDVCPTCATRRVRIDGYKWSEKQCLQSAMLSEIGGEKGRVALISARIGLRDWLNGTMVRTLMVTEPEGIQALGQQLEAGRFVDLNADAADFRQWLGPANEKVATYQSMLKDLSDGLVQNNTDWIGASVWGRGVDPHKMRLHRSVLTHIMTEDRQTIAAQHPNLPGATKDLLLFNAVCAKNPTPSTTLDTWRQIREFFQSFGGDGEDSIGGVDGLGPRNREWRRVERVGDVPAPNDRSTLFFPAQNAEAVFDDEGYLWVVRRTLPTVPGTLLRTDTGLEFRVIASGTRPNAYRPFRIIVAEADVFLALVPAESAMAVTKALHAFYLRWFGKVWGRLPLAIGNIFFPAHQPMYAVLDAAWRQLARFRELQEWNFLQKRPLRPGLPDTLGTCAGDFHHPYAIVDEADKSPQAIWTVGGWIEHFRNIGARGVLVKPNLYEALVVGSGGGRLGHALREGPIPLYDNDSELRAYLRNREGNQPIGLMTIEDMERMETAWNAIGQDERAALRNTLQALEIRRVRWNEPEIDPGLGVDLLESAIPLTDITREAAREGLLWRALRLHLQAMKEGKDA